MGDAVVLGINLHCVDIPLDMVVGDDDACVCVKCFLSCSTRMKQVSL